MLECPGLIGVFFVGLIGGVGLMAAVDWLLGRLYGKVKGMGLAVEVKDWREMGEALRGDKSG